MTRFLAIARRFFLGGVVSLTILMVVKKIGFKELLYSAIPNFDYSSVFKLYFATSPVFYLLLTTISTIYIRAYGQFAVFHQTQLPITTFFRLVGSDIVSPFKNLKNFIAMIFSKNVIGGHIIVLRTVEMIVLIIINCFGIVACR